MKKAIAVLILTASNLSLLNGGLPAGSTLTNINDGYSPTNWYDVSPNDLDYTLQFRADFWNGSLGDLWFLMKYKNSSNVEKDLKFLFRTNHDYVFVYPEGFTSLSSMPLDATLQITPQWHEIRIKDRRVTFVYSTSSDGPWTQYFDYIIPEAVSTHTEYTFGSYGQPTYYLKMANFTFSATAPEPPPHSISWQDQGDDVYQAVASKFRTYHYDSSIAYNQSITTENLAGPLSRTTTNGKWAYDSAAGNITTAPGNWMWLATDDDTQYNYHYDAETKKWEPVDWSSGAGTSTHKSYVPWTYDSTTLTWSNTQQVETWTYDAITKKWTGISMGIYGGTLSQTWSFDYATSEWTNEHDDDVWEHYSPYMWLLKSHSFAYKAFIAPENGAAIRSEFSSLWFGPANQGRVWGSSDQNFYQSGNIDERYNWEEPTDSRPRGLYLRYDGGSTDGSSKWKYTNPQQWKLNGSGSAKRFPVHYPPLAVLQHQDIISAYDTAVAAGILTESAESAPTATWEVSARSNEFGVTITYDTAEGTAPLKVTTSSPDTQLLSNLLYNPVFTSLGDWEYKDTTNSHTWTFDDATGTWQNSTTGYQWSYSNPTALRWHHAASGTYWEYDENTESWTQLVDDGD